MTFTRLVLIIRLEFYVLLPSLPLLAAAGVRPSMGTLVLSASFMRIFDQYVRNPTLFPFWCILRLASWFFIASYVACFELGKKLRMREPPERLHASIFIYCRMEQERSVFRSNRMCCRVCLVTLYYC